jgi:hypothetical protein
LHATQLSRSPTCVWQLILLQPSTHHTRIDEVEQQAESMPLQEQFT